MSELYLQRSPSAAFRRLGQECIVMSATDSTLFSLNEVATVLWESADGFTPLSQIVRDSICTEFDVEHGQALGDAEQFARALAQRGILLLSEQPVLQASCENELP